MKRILYFFIFFLLSIQLSLFCMQEIPVKLNNDGSHHMVPLSVIQKSNSIYEKYLWKVEKPIVVHNISSQGLDLFIHASQKTEITFPTFFNKLKREEQQELISVAGVDKLNSPEITALLAQSYLLPDIVQKYIIPHLGQTVVKHYLQHAMIIRNMNNSSLAWKDIFFPKHKTFSCANGFNYEIPENFNAHTDLYTTNLSNHVKSFDLSNPNDLTLTHMKKQVGSYEYQIISESLDTSIVRSIWRIKDKQVIKKELLLNGVIITASCSADGNFIAICTQNDTNNNTLLLQLDHTSDEIITKEINLTQNLPRLVDVQFSKTSHALFVLSYDENTHKSQLLLYDLHNLQEKLLIFDGTETSPTINHDASRMIFYCPDTLSIWDISSLLNPVLLCTIDINQIGQETAEYYNEKHNTDVSSTVYVSAVQYMHKSNNAVAQLHNGNMLFINEISPHEITYTVSINPYTYLLSFTKNILLSSLLHTPDNNFLISHSAIKTDTDRINSYLTVWNTQSKKIVVSDQHYRIEQYPVIVMSCDACSFIINVGTQLKRWMPYILFTHDEKITCDWIDNPKRTLFSLYALHRLYQAHINDEEIIVHKNDALDTFLETLSKESCNIKECITKYLMVQHKKNIVETMEIQMQALMDTCENALDTCKSFFKNLGK